MERTFSEVFDKISIIFCCSIINNPANNLFFYQKWIRNWIDLRFHPDLLVQNTQKITPRLPTDKLRRPRSTPLFFN